MERTKVINEDLFIYDINAQTEDGADPGEDPPTFSARLAEA